MTADTAAPPVRDDDPARDLIASVTRLAVVIERQTTDNEAMRQALQKIASHRCHDAGDARLMSSIANNVLLGKGAQP
jgi:hypothetical protein